MPKTMTDPKLEGLPAGGQGSATVEEMVRRFPDLFKGTGTANTGNPSLDTSLQNIAQSHTPAAAPIDMQETSPGQWAPPGSRPPANYTPIDYSPEGRARFSDVVLNRLGANPFEIDPYDYVDQVNDKLPEIFNKVFQGKVVWSDRDKLDKDQAKFWNNVVKSIHAQVYDRVTNKKKILTDQYNFMMNRFDNEAKAKEAAKKKLESMGAAPKTQILESKQKGVYTLHQWNPETKKYEDTGQVARRTKEPQEGNLPRDVEYAMNQVLKDIKGVSPILDMMARNNPDIVKEKWYQDRVSAAASEDKKKLFETYWNLINDWQKQVEARRAKQAGTTQPTTGTETPTEKPAATRVIFDASGKRIQ